MTIVAILPARGGSKRIPKKNIKNFHGIPIICRTLETIINSSCFDRVIVSTDCREIIKTVSQIPTCEIHRRTPELSDDATGTQQVIKNACDEMSLNDSDLICCIYPTAVFLTEKMVTDSLQEHIHANCRFTFAVKEYFHPIQRAFSCENKIIKLPQSVQENTRTQDLQKRFHDVGYFYWGKCEFWKNSCPVIADGNQAFILKKNEVWDIDDFEDWNLAEIIWSGMYG